jgi:hypothetical protein
MLCASLFTWQSLPRQATDVLQQLRESAYQDSCILVLIEPLATNKLMYHIMS